MAYTDFDVTKPDGATQAGTAHGNSTKANGAALRDSIMMGQMKGFVFSVSGGTAAQPTTMLWKNGAIWLKGEVTWGSGAGQDGNITQIIWSLSLNSGGAYDAIGTQVLAYDTSSNLTTTTVAGGFVAWLMSYMGKWFKLRADTDAHIAATGASVHGLASMALQSAAAVAITGGTAILTTEREVSVNLGNVNSSTAVNWALAGHFYATITGASGAFTFSNLPPAGQVGYIALELTNPGVSTFANLFPSVKKSGGVAPTLTVAGRDIFSLMCRDGATVNLVGSIPNLS